MHVDVSTVTEMKCNATVSSVNASSYTYVPMHPYL